MSLSENWSKILLPVFYIIIKKIVGKTYYHVENIVFNHQLLTTSTTT